MPAEKSVPSYDFHDIESLIGTPNNPSFPDNGAVSVSPDAQAPPPPPAPAKDPETGRFVSPKPPPSPFLRRMAKDLGMSDEDIAEVDAAGLEHTVYQLNKLRGDSQRSQLAQHDHVQQLAQSPTVPAAAGSASGGERTPPDAFDIGEVAEQMDEKLLATLKAMHSHIGTLRQRLEQLEARESARAEGEVLNRLDRKFAERPDLFGKGPSRTLDPDSPESVKRRAVAAHLRELIAAKRQTELESDVEKATAALWGAAKPEPEVKAEPKGKFTADQWNQGGLARPQGSAAADDLPPVKKAERGVREKLQSMASANGRGDDEFIP